MGIPPWFLCPPALLEPRWWCCCASPMCTAQSLLPPGAVTTTIRHCPRAWGNYFTSTRGSQSRHRRARVPPRTNRINTTPTALGGARGCRTRLDCTGIWILVCVLLRRLKLRWNTSTAQAGLQKQPSLPAMCSLFIKTRHFCADTIPAQSCSSSGWDSVRWRELCKQRWNQILQLEGTQPQQPHTEHCSSALLAAGAGLAAQLCSLLSGTQGFCWAEQQSSLWAPVQDTPGSSRPFLPISVWMRGE